MSLFKVKKVYAHCDLPCGIYDPAQARIEAESVRAIMDKYDDELDIDIEQKIRAITIKEQRCELVKRHLWVLWTDYFKPEHLEKFPDLHNKFWMATKQAGKCKKTINVDDADKLLDMIDEIAKIFAETKNG